MTHELDLEAISARADAATEGPWHNEHDEFGCVQQGNYGWVAPGPGPEYDVDSEQGKADAEFIAHARTDVPKLVYAVEKLIRERDSLGRRCAVRFGEAEEARAEASQARDERDKALAEVERLRKLIEPLREWRALWHPDSTPYSQERALIAAVDAYEDHIGEGGGEPLSRRSLDAETLLWAADELDAQAEAHNQNLIDYTDHLRCFTEQPQRKSIVPRPGGDVPVESAPAAERMQLQVDGTYEPVPAPIGYTRCPACQSLPIGHEGDCEPC